MDIFKEFILTVLISMSLAFLIAKLVSAASSSGGGGGGGGGSNNNKSVLDQENIAAAPLKSEKKKKKKKKSKKLVIDEERSFVSGELKNTGLEIETRVEESVEVNDGLVDKIGLISKELSDSKEGVKFVEIVGEDEKSVKEDEEKELKTSEISGDHSTDDDGKVVENLAGEMSERDIIEISGDHSTDDGKVVENLAGEMSERDIIEISGDHSTDDGKVVENLAGEMSERDIIGLGLENSHVVVEKESELKEKSGIDSWVSDEEEWEGIERSEVENYFATASKFVSSGVNSEISSKLTSDVQMQLYGLHKVATEGPCYEPQPMALMVSARAKWHAWQRLGNMSPEAAMEQYTTLLSENVPGWTGRNAEGESKQDHIHDSSEAEISGMIHQNLTSSQLCQPVSEDERKSGDCSSAERSDGTPGAKIL